MSYLADVTFGSWAFCIDGFGEGVEMAVMTADRVVVAVANSPVASRESEVGISPCYVEVDRDEVDEVYE